MAKRSKSIVRVSLVNAIDGVRVRATVRGKRIALENTRSGEGYIDNDSAARQWRKEAERLHVSNYEYRTVIA